MKSNSPPAMRCAIGAGARAVARPGSRQAAGAASRTMKELAWQLDSTRTRAMRGLGSLGEQYKGAWRRLCNAVFESKSPRFDYDEVRKLSRKQFVRKGSGRDSTGACRTQFALAVTIFAPYL